MLLTDEEGMYSEYSRWYYEKEFPENATETTRITTRKTSAIILEEIRKNAHITREELAVICGITIDGIKWQLKKMQEKEILYRDGTNGGKWVILNTEHYFFKRSTM